MLAHHTTRRVLAPSNEQVEGPRANFIAPLINTYVGDPKLENPDNGWNRIVRAGVIEAYQKNLEKTI